MLWVIVDKVVTLLTLVMLVLMVTVIYTNNKSSQEITGFETKLSEYKLENQTTRSNNIAYIEKRINKLQEQQDTYQILVDRRLLNMETQVKLLTDSGKNNQKVINNNINTVGNITSR